VTKSKATKKKQRALLIKWRGDPLAYFDDVFGIDLLGGPWAVDGQRAYQAEILMSIAENSETYIVTGNGVGKDFILGHAVPWWMTTRKNAICITTAPKDEQVRKILWGEIRTAHLNAKVQLGGRLMPSDPYWVFGPKWYATGLVGRDENSFQGFHAEHILVVGDEAAGIPEFFWPAMLGCAVGENDRLVMIGNPTCAPTHSFAKGCREQDVPTKKKTIRVKSTETPNYVQGREVIRGLMSREGVERIYKKYRKGSAIANARVEAKFDDGGTNSLITYAHIGPCRDRLAAGVKPTEHDHTRVGCDVARFGDDLTVIYVRRGPSAWVPQGGILAKADQVQVTDAVGNLAASSGAVTTSIDGGAMGPGPIDFLRANREGFRLRGDHRVIEVLFGAKAYDEEQFADKRTELWWNLRDWLRDEAAMEIDDELEEELLAPTFSWVKRRVRLEPKDKTKELLGRSPDRADALALAVAGHVGSGPSLVLSGGHDPQPKRERDEGEDDEAMNADDGIHLTDIGSW